MRARVKVIEGPAEAWDPANPGPFRALTGGQFTGQDGELALVRTEGGCIQHIHPGWIAIRPAGSSVACFSTPERTEVLPGKDVT